MRDHYSDQSTLEGRPDVRKFERKRVPSNGTLTTATGAILSDCTILDLSLVGAQIALPTTQSIPDRVFLVDPANRIAYDAHVPWWRPRSAGLAFREVYQLDRELPADLEFLKGVLIDAKLRQVDALIAGGDSLPEAVHAAGISGAMYARWKSERADGSDLGEHIWQLEMEIAQLRKLLAEFLGNRALVEDCRSGAVPSARSNVG